MEVGRIAMNVQVLIETAQAMAAGGNGLLEMDENNGTRNQRFASARHPANGRDAARQYSAVMEAR